MRMIFFGGDIMGELILFILTYVFVFIIYQLFFVVPAKKRKNNKKSKKKELIEINYLQYKYKIDMDKIKYNQLLQICAIISSFDIALSVTIISLFDGVLMVLLGGFFVVVMLILVSYHFVYLFYKRKGMIKDGDK